MATATRDVQAALVALFEATLAQTDTEVFDGPRIRGRRPKEYVLVGVNGLEEDAAGLRSTQGPSAMSGDWREESGEIDCTVVVWDGDPKKLDAIRTTADGIVAACETAVNSDRRLGGTLQPANHFAHLTALDTREAQTDKGPFVEAVFTISYTTTLTS